MYTTAETYPEHYIWLSEPSIRLPRLSSIQLTLHLPCIQSPQIIFGYCNLSIWPIHNHDYWIFVFLVTSTERFKNVMSKVIVRATVYSCIEWWLGLSGYWPQPSEFSLFTVYGWYNYSNDTYLCIRSFQAMFFFAVYADLVSCGWDILSVLISCTYFTHVWIYKCFLSAFLSKLQDWCSAWQLKLFYQKLSWNYFVIYFFFNLQYHGIIINGVSDSLLHL